MAHYLCKTFGHVPPRRPVYFRVRPTAIDGLNTEHADCLAPCERCGEQFVVGHIHLPAREREKALERKLKAIKEAI